MMKGMDWVVIHDGEWVLMKNGLRRDVCRFWDGLREREIVFIKNNSKLNKKTGKELNNSN